VDCQSSCNSNVESYVTRTGEKRNASRILLVKPEGKGPLGRPRCGWEDNIKMDLKRVRMGSTDWIYLAQRPV
jgi:hypothetical protein